MIKKYTLYDELKSEKELIDFLTKRESQIRNNSCSRENIVLSALGNPSQDEKDKLLDYGCGWGYISRRAAESGWEVTGIDISENEISIAQLMYKHENTGSKIIYSTDTIDSFPEKYFDAVISTEVIEHVHNPGLYLSRINRVLKNNGKLIISIPNIMTINNVFNHLYKTFTEGLLKTSQKIHSHYDKAHIHINSWDAFHFTQFVSSVGFLLDEFRPMEHRPLPRHLACLRKPFFQKIFNKTLRLQPLRRSMLFKFSKIEDKIILPYE